MRVVIFSSAPAAKLHHLLRRLSVDLPNHTVSVVYQAPQKKPSGWQRVWRFLRLFPNPDYRRRILNSAATRVRDFGLKAVDHFLHWVHACPTDPNGPQVTLTRLARESSARGVPFLITADIGDERTSAFVCDLRPDIGVVFGISTSAPALFTLPARGSINVHTRGLPVWNVPGTNGPQELWEETHEVTVTVSHVGTGGVLGARSFTSGEFDTLHSMGLKSDLVEVDLLIDVLRANCDGCAADAPMDLAGSVPGGSRPQKQYTNQRRIRAARRAPPVRRGRSLGKLLLRTLTYPLLGIRNWWRRWRASFPVVILYHHLVVDRPHHLGITTDQFSRHLRFLKKHYRIASLPEAVQILKTGRCTAPTVVLTFDDGYAENFLSLRAVAEAEEISTAVFVCTQHLTDGSGYQHDQNRGQTDFPPLNWDQVRYLDGHGVTVGSHTRRHFDCGSSDLTALSEEVVSSREELERNLGHEVLFFAFPKGKPWNMSAVAINLASRTYPFFLSGYGGVNRGPCVPPLELKRSSHPESLWELELLLQSVLNFRRERPPADYAVQLTPQECANEATLAPTPLFQWSSR